MENINIFDIFKDYFHIDNNILAYYLFSASIAALVTFIVGLHGSFEIAREDDFLRFLKYVLFAIPAGMLVIGATWPFFIIFCLFGKLRRWIS